MPTYQLLTDRTLAQASAITPTTLIHIVYTGDPSQNPAGSSYKAELGQLVGLFSGGSVSGEYLPLSGGTVSGTTNFTNGLTANTISATTYQNLPISGTHNYLSKFSSGSTILVDSQLRDDGSTVGIGLPPNVNAKLFVLTSSEPYGLAGQNQGTNGIGVYGQALALGNTTGVFGLANGTSTSNIGVNGQANDATTNIGLKGYAFNGTNNYSIQLLDGTEGVGKVLTSVTSDGKANWQILPTFTGNTSATCINEFYVSDIYGCTGTTFHNQVCFETIPTGTTGYTLSVNENGCLLIATGTTSETVITNNVVATDSFSGPRGNFSDYVRVSKIKSFSPLLINYGDEGDVYFGSTSGVTIDVLNSRIGIGTTSPSEKLDVSGKTKTINFQMTSGATNGYVLTSDASGNASWQASTISGDYLPLSGGTVTGTTTFTNGLTANTISATTIGNSGDCVDDLYVTNIHSCSPLNINPLNEGNVYFGSTSGVSIDLSNTRFGIGTSTPQFPFQIVGANSTFYYDPTSVGGRFNVSGNTNIPRYDVSIGAYLTRPATGGSVGMRSWNDVVYVGYGKVGDMHIYAGNEAYGLNIINGPGTNTEDYIRFYAGTDATSTSDIHIQGTGTTRGFVGLGIENPTAKLHVFGSTIVTGTLTATTVSATTYQNLPVSGLTAGTNIGLTNNNGNFTISVTGITGGSSINPFNDSGSGSTITWDVSGVSTNYEATLTATTTLNLINVRNGEYGTIIIKQDGVGGRTLTLGTVNGGAGTHRVVNGGGGSIVLTSNASATDILTFTYNGSVMYWTVGNDYT